MRLPQKLSRISPSTYAALLKCPLRACLASDREQPAPILSGPVAQIGTITHELLELASKGDVLESEMESKWSALVAEKETELKENVATVWMVPLCETAFRFTERSHLAVSHARKVARETASTRQEETGGFRRACNPSIKAEEWMVTPDGKIGGQIDCLVETPEGVIIRDFKTGAIFEKKDEQSGEALELKEDYKLQLQLYAGIYFENKGQWPKALEVIPMSGKTETIAVVPEECETLLRDAKAKLDKINELLAAADAKTLAMPTPSSCKYCGFRPTCDSYKSASGMNGGRLDAPDKDKWPIDASGKIKEQSQIGSKTLITLDNGLRIVVNSEIHADLRGAPKGTPIEAYGLVPLRSGAFEAWRGSYIIIGSSLRTESEP